MDVSVIIVNWNTRDLVVGCIGSIMSSKPRISYEIVAVDNGSSDGSAKAIKALFRLKRFAGRDTLIKNGTNLGFAKANNQGIKKAKGKYILLLNSDAKVKKGAIDKLIEFAERTENAGVVGARLLNEDGSVQESANWLPTTWRTVRQYWFGEAGVLDKYTPGVEGASEVEAVVGAAFLITPEARRRVGLLDERYFMYFEDLDYCRRVRRAGLKVYYMPGSEVYHYHGASGKDLRSWDNQWRRLIPSSKIYHGLVKHYVIWFVMWSGQKCRKFWR